MKLVPHFIIRGTQMWNEQEQAARSKALSIGVVFWKPEDEFKTRMDTFRKDELTNLADDMKKRGVAEPEKLIRLHLVNIEKWKKKFAEMGQSPERLEDALRQEIFAKVLQ